MKWAASTGGICDLCYYYDVIQCSFLCALLTLLLSISSPTSSYALLQTATPQSPVSQKLTTELAQNTVAAELSELHTQNAYLEGRLTALIEGMQFWGSVISVILAIGFLLTIGLVVWSELRGIQAETKAEKRAAEASRTAEDRALVIEERAKRAFELSFSGELSSQERASDAHNVLLKGSQETLRLVNDTLQLAYDASKRAADAIRDKAKRMLEELDEECRELLDSVPSHKDRALIENPDKRSDLRSLAQRIAGFEINNFVLPEDLALTASCHFIRGLDLHIHQQFKDAMKYWKKAATDTEASRELKSLAWYWDGYEENNLANFAAAERSFGKALETAAGLREFELRRIQLESRFFGLSSDSSPSELIKSLTSLLNEIKTKDTSSAESKERLTKITVTLANVLSQYGMQLRESDSTLAAQQFQLALDSFSTVSSTDKWALFGKAEMLFELGRTTEAAAIFDGELMTAVQQEAIRREEPRTKVLAKTTELICCLKGLRFKHNSLNVLGEVFTELGRVDPRLTIYSQSRKRNVIRDLFEQDLDLLRQMAVAAQTADG